MYQQLTITGYQEPRNTTSNKTFKSTIKERISKYGVNTITDKEILSTLTDIPIEKITEYGIIEMGKNVDALNITETQKRKLALIFEISRKIASANIIENEIIDSSIKAGRFFQNLLKGKPIEEFVLTLLDSQNRVIKTITTNIGTINESAVYPREIVKHSILNNSNSVIFSHNHPGNTKKPSNCDIKLTEKLKSALETVNIKVVDHVIVTDDSYYSFAESGLL